MLIATFLFLLLDGPATRTAIILGPVATQVSDDAFAPARVWRPGLSAAERSRAAVGGSLFAALAIGCGLLKSRKQTFIALGSLSLVSVGVIAWWRSSLPSIQQIGGDVVIVGADPADASRLRIEQVDRWQFFATRETGPVEAIIPLHMNSVPIFCDRFPREATGAAVADHALHATLHRGDRLAVLTRSMSDPGDSDVAIDAARITPTSSVAMGKLARAEYRALAITALGELDSSERDDWATIVLRRE